MVAKCFYLSRNLFPRFGYGKLKCVFAVIWPYTWYMEKCGKIKLITLRVINVYNTATLIQLNKNKHTNSGSKVDESVVRIEENSFIF